MHSEFNQSVNNLPKNLKVLAVGSEFTQSIDNLPDSIQKLFLLNPDYNTPIHKLPRDLNL